MTERESRPAGELCLASVAETLEFHKLATYLCSPASTFTTFYETCPVLHSEGETRQSRLVLCDLTARTLDWPAPARHRTSRPDVIAHRTVDASTATHACWQDRASCRLIRCWTLPLSNGWSRTWKA
ncbi:DALR anticodon-binding domain-containing protein [Streptomyces sp. NPDC055400]